MHKINVKPLSLNKAYRGRRFITQETQQFKDAMFYLLPQTLDVDFISPMQITLEFGVSSHNADGDNCIKMAQDSIADKYNFNDKLIFKWVVEKIKVPKGQEYIAFDLKNI